MLTFKNLNAHRIACLDSCTCETACSTQFALVQSMMMVVSAVVRIFATYTVVGNKTFVNITPRNRRTLNLEPLDRMCVFDTHYFQNCKV